MREHEEDIKVKGFDLTVTHRDSKTGLVIKNDPYTLHVVGNSDGSKSQYFERPKGSGNVWNKQSGEPDGRWINGKYDAKAEHVAWIPPETSDAKVAREYMEAKAQLSAARAELEAIKAENAKKAASAKKDKES